MACERAGPKLTKTTRERAKEQQQQALTFKLILHANYQNWPDAGESGAAPRIVHAPPGLSVAKLGEQPLLVCLAQGSPRPTVRWFRAQPDEPQRWLELPAGQPKGGAHNDSHPKYSVSNQGSFLHLRQLSAQLDQGARFKCLANNSFGAAQAETELQLEVWPATRVLELEPRLEFVAANGHLQAQLSSQQFSQFHLPSTSDQASHTARFLTLNCTARRSPSQAPLESLEWLHNGRPMFSVSLAQLSVGGDQVGANFSRAASLFDEQLELKLVEFLDQQPPAAGLVGPEAQLYSGGAVEDELANQDSQALPLGDEAQQQQQQQVVSSATLNKLAELADDFRQPPAGQARKLASPMHTLRPLAGQEALLYQLHLPLPLRRHLRGSYQCRARTPRTTLQAASSVLLRDSAPQFVETFASQLVSGQQQQQVSSSTGALQQQLQHQASLKCVASGAPLPEISWTLSGFAVPESARFRVGDYVTRDGLIVSFVNITNVQPEGE